MGEPGMLGKENNFGGDLRFSYEHELFWDAIYKKVFPTIVSQEFMENGGFQKLGIDRVLTLSNGRFVFTEEKMRAVVYPDILLEYIADSVRNTPGWIEKDLQCHFLSYAFLPTKKCYLFPWTELRAVWLTYKPLFLKLYRTVEARNPSYSTLSVAVPISTLCGLVPNTLVVALE